VAATRWRQPAGISSQSPGAGLAAAVTKLELGAALGEQHPFVVGLRVPEAGRAGVKMGEDALDAQAGPGEECLEVLFCGRRGIWANRLAARIGRLRGEDEQDTAEKG
jgi:hypothetical protein